MKILSFDIGLKNLAYCFCEFNENNVKIFEWDVECLSNVKKVLPLDELNKKIINFFDKNPQFLKTDYILIEQQPTKNPLMKNISIMIHSYFIIRGIIDKQINKSTIEKVLFFSPKNKLKVYDGPEIVCNLKSRYSQRKKIGIEQTKYFISKYNLSDYSDVFNKSKKKDDLADSFLQALCYYKFKEYKNNQNPKANFHKWKGISRKPTKKQLVEGNFTLPNLRYYFKTIIRNEDFPKNEIEIQKYFPDVYEFIIKCIKSNFGENAVDEELINKL